MNQQTKGSMETAVGGTVSVVPLPSVSSNSRTPQTSNNALLIPASQPIKHTSLSLTYLTRPLNSLLIFEGITLILRKKQEKEKRVSKMALFFYLKCSMSRHFLFRLNQMRT